MNVRNWFAALTALLFTASDPAFAVVCDKGPYIVFFAQDNATLNAESKALLDAATNAAASCAEGKIFVMGYSDLAESQKIDITRAKNVRFYLAAHGVPESDLSVKSFGSRQPRIPNRDGKPEAQNRRVEIIYGPPYRRFMPRP